MTALSLSAGAGIPSPFVMALRKDTAYDREDRDLIIELRTESKNQTRMLEEHTGSLKFIQKTMQEFSDAMDKRFQDLDARKMDRTEANRLQSDYLSEQVNLKKDMNDLKTSHNEFLTTLRIFRIMFIVFGFIIGSIVIPFIVAFIQSHL